jgi:hypothetical protein
MPRKRTTNIPLKAEIKKIPPATMSNPKYNTITLSTDMEILYLIDNGRAIAFPLDKYGVIVGTLMGQIAVVTPMRPTDNDPAPNNTLSFGDTSGVPDPSRVLALKLPTKGFQWNIIFIPNQRRIGVIGVTDIGLGAKSTENTAFEAFTNRGFTVDISRDAILIRKIGDIILLNIVDKETSPGGATV